MKIDMAGVSVMLAMPTHRDLPPETVQSLLATQMACMQHGIDFGGEFGKGSSLVHHARSKVAWHFLQTDYQYLFWVDSDQAWEPASFIRVLGLATLKDVVAATYPGRHEGAGFFLTPLAEQAEADEHGCIPVKELGLGFACVKRKVVEELAERAPLAIFKDINGGEPIPHIFHMGVDEDGFAVGEDVGFWRDIRALGYSVNVDPTIRLGHIGPKVYTGALIDYLIKET